VIKRGLDVVVVLVAACLLLILAFGGIDIGLGPLRLRLHDWSRPLLLLAVALAARAWLASAFAAGGATADESRAPDSAAADKPLAPGAPLAPYLSTCALIALLLAIAVAYGQHHVRIAGGLDSYGYVSAASLLASGHLTEPQKLVTLLPFEHASAAAAPLGYVPGPDEHTNVPRFPLGLPLVMALFRIFGPSAPFFVPLLMSFGTVALAYLMAKEPGMPAAGLFAAVLVAADPLMFHYGVQPMSDVPAAFWLIAALWLRLERPRWGIASGLCAGMAILTRPALIPAVVVLGLVTADLSSIRPTIRFVATLCAFLVAQMVLNRALYGNISSSGYGPAEHMFQLSAARVAANVSNFGKWLTYSHTALVWVLWPAGMVILRHRAWAWQISAVAAAAAAPYLFYLVFDDWESSRFLLPAIVLVLILFARAMAVALAPHAPARPAPLRRASPSHPPPRLAPQRRTSLAHLVLLLLAFAWVFSSHHFLDREGVYRFASVESKYALVGEWFKTHTPERAVVLAGLHSGSIRFYGQRETIRWDQIPADKLEATLHNLRDQGYETYLALDVPSEPPLFQAKFGSQRGAAAEQIARVRVVNIYRFVSAY
jgi:hypothetical protein